MRETPGTHKSVVDTWNYHVLELFTLFFLHFSFLLPLSSSFSCKTFLFFILLLCLYFSFFLSFQYKGIWYDYLDYLATRQTNKGLIKAPWVSLKQYNKVEKIPIFWLLRDANHHYPYLSTFKVDAIYINI